MSDAAAPLAPPLHRRLLQNLSSTLAPLTFLLILCAVLAVLSPRFLSQDNLTNVAVQSAVVAILACGQTVIIISGNIDLSVGSVMAVAGVVAAQAMKQYGMTMWGGVFAACLMGGACGVLTGTITAYGKIPAFIVTLGMMGILQGLAGIFSKSQNIGGLPAAFKETFGSGGLFHNGTSAAIPYAVLMMVAAAALVHLALTRTKWGRAVYAMGGNREAARLSGIRLTWMTVSVFMLSGLLSGVASIINVARSSVASQNAGVGFELYAVAATVVGGTSLFGGKGGIPGTVIGAVIIFTIDNGCTLKGYGPEIKRVIIGTVVILAVLFDRYRPGQWLVRRLFGRRTAAAD